jgi:hypothetical protein
MRLVLHIVAKDTRRIFGLLVLWVPLVLTTLWAAWHAREIDPSVHWAAVEMEPGVVERARLVSIYFQIMLVVVTYVSAASLIVEDPATGNTGFWMTRPVSGVRLVAAKLLTGATWFIAVPTLAVLVWWGAAGEVPERLISLARAAVTTQTLLVVVAFAIATFTGTFGRFVGVTFGLGLIGVVVANTHVLQMLPATDGTIDVLNIASRAIAIGLPLAAIARYQTRRMQGPIAVAGLALFGTVAVVLWAAK